ncbi:acyl-CoA dehydrogenase/oxidase [Phascolomyces articulosus]|uniref:Acyl-coenzyme A oxidase n=1 Tax=Phascolomyces articulosus TaxID=60185 RepID=A0AAD5KPR9_9FUNG|nr:acyl-CoA dehydrogenase/oxidase [Phascolomyces articulosus]
MSLQAPKDMAAERAAADFNIEGLARLWAGGDKQYELRKRAYEIMKNDPELIVQPPRNILEFSRDEWREFTMGQIYRVAQLTKEYSHDREFASEIDKALNVYSKSYAMRVFVHDSLFRNVINMLGTKEQAQKWNDDIDERRVYGCFAMTELGHSSALRDIETCATFDVATDEFVIESPTVTSTKWWIGGSGQTSTHAVVISQTVIQGEHKGHNWFIVQLRDKVTGELMPGVRIGDIGGKVGHNGVDNGWIQFRGLRIPRENMLQKWSRLERDGNYTPAPSPAVMYATLIPERLSLIGTTTQICGQALTIATRYGVVRRQGSKNEQIMDYQSHYSQLIPAISFMYMVNSAATTIDDQMEVLTAGGEMNPTDYLNHMGDMHAVSACLKSMTGWYGSEILETCRRACGGHAYSSYNGIGQLIADWGVVTTGAGDNVVLLQQTSRILVSRLDQKLQHDKYPELKFKSSAHYILRAKEYLATPSWPVRDIDTAIKNLALLEDGLNAILLNSIREAMAKDKTSNDLLTDSVRVAEMHCAVFLFSDAVSKYGAPHAPEGVDKSVYSIMRRLTILWGLHTLVRYADQGYKEGFLNPQHIKAVEEKYLETSKSLRKQAIGLTDAFNFPDFIIKAPIAKYDGNIYEPYFETLLQAPNSVGKTPYHAKYIKPLTERVCPNNN